VYFNWSRAFKSYSIGVWKGLWHSLWRLRAGPYVWRAREIVLVKETYRFLCSIPVTYCRRTAVTSTVLLSIWLLFPLTIDKPCREAMELKNGRALGRRFPFWLMSPGNTRKKHSVVCSFGGCWTVFSTSPSMWLYFEETLSSSAWSPFWGWEKRVIPGQ
jgi:hypothetical protein